MPSVAATVPRRGFPRTFWVANVMELFERAAYYGMNSVLAVYLTGKVETGGLGWGWFIHFLQNAVIYSFAALAAVG